MSKRRTHSPEFKARVAMEAISGRKTIQEIAADHAIHPIQVSQWKKQMHDGASELYNFSTTLVDRLKSTAMACRAIARLLLLLLRSWLTSAKIFVFKALQMDTAAGSLGRPGTTPLTGRDVSKSSEA